MELGALAVRTYMQGAKGAHLAILDTSGNWATDDKGNPGNLIEYADLMYAEDKTFTVGDGQERSWEIRYDAVAGLYWLTPSGKTNVIIDKAIFENGFIQCHFEPKL